MLRLDRLTNIYVCMGSVGSCRGFETNVSNLASVFFHSAYFYAEEYYLENMTLTRLKNVHERLAYGTNIMAYDLCKVFVCVLQCVLFLPQSKYGKTLVVRMSLLATLQLCKACLA